MIKKTFTTVILAAFSIVAYAGDPYRDFDFGWQLFQKGSYETALKIVDGALELDLKDDLRANYLYLKGHLLIKLDIQDERAIQAFNRAKTHYSRINQGKKTIDQLRCDQGLVRAYIARENYKQAQNVLNRLKSDALLEKERGYLYYLAARVAFGLGDYPQALQESQASLNAYEISLRDGRDYAKKGITDARLGIARAQLLLGDYEAGNETNLKAQGEIMSLGDSNKFYFGLINQILYQRCALGGEANGSIRMIESRLIREPDADLQRLLEFAKTWVCQ